MTASGGFEDGVGTNGRWGALAVLRMEISLILGSFGIAPVIDLKPVFAWLFAQVGHRQACRVLEGPRNIAVACSAGRSRVGEVAAPGINGKQGRAALLGQSEADAEEVADRDLDARLYFSVPVGTQYVVLQMMRFTAGDVVTEMGDAARPLNFGENQGLAGFELTPIIIISCGVCRRDPVGLEVVEGRQVVQSEILGLGEQTGAEKWGHPDSCFHGTSVDANERGGKLAGETVPELPQTHTGSII
jgi:hypothetical protein